MSRTLTTVATVWLMIGCLAGCASFTIGFIPGGSKEVGAIGLLGMMICLAGLLVLYRNDET